MKFLISDSYCRHGAPKKYVLFTSITEMKFCKSSTASLKCIKEVQKVMNFPKKTFLIINDFTSWQAIIKF